MIETKGFYEFGPFRINSVERLLLRDGAVVPLPLKAFDTLLLLARNSGRILSKEELMKAIWPDTYVEEASLAQNISVLRRALGEAAGERQYIETIPRRGYRFLPKVEDKPQSEGSTLAERVTSDIVQEHQEPTRVTRRSRTRYIAATATAGLAGLLVGVLVSRHWLTPALNINPYSLTPLATAPGLEVHPSWAPNGKTIAYAGEVDGTFQIFTKTLGSSMPTPDHQVAEGLLLPNLVPGRQANPVHLRRRHIRS